MPLLIINSSLQTYQIHGCLMSAVIGPINFKLCKTLTLFVCVLSRFSRIWLFVTPCSVAFQAPLSMGFSRQEYWSGLPCTSPGDLPKPGIKPLCLMSPALTGRFFTTGSTLGFPILHYLTEFAQIHVHWVSDAIPPPCLLFFLLSVFPSIRVFSNESVHHPRWLKYWSFSVSINPSNEYSGLISFRNDWFDFLAVQDSSRVFSGTTVQKHRFFIAQLSLWSNSHISMTTGKTIAFTIWTLLFHPYQEVL